MSTQIERLNCAVKNYAWGKLGENSEVARLYVEGHEDKEINSDTPYAELWIGTHPDAFYKRYRLQLPFIMKIMSIRHTLSLQVHPTKEQAILLNKQNPINYPDQNHKPELAYALTRFELLCGFRPAGEILENMKAFPELCQAMGYQNTKQFIELSKQFSPDSYEMINALRKCSSTFILTEGENIKCIELNSKKCFVKQFTAKRGFIFYIPPMHTIRFLSNNGLYLKGFRTFSFEDGPDHSKRILFNNEKTKSNNLILNNDTSMDVIKQQTTKTKLILNPSLNIFDIETEMDGFL
uniref:Phosphomannose isomerase type I catalytic domain-containing protein n=1 Tax=Meloidogyne floridensis TaxID=298350 RepID=A0A915NZ35_9BILA